MRLPEQEQDSRGVLIELHTHTHTHSICACHLAFVNLSQGIAPFFATDPSPGFQGQRNKETPSCQWAEKGWVGGSGNGSCCWYYFAIGTTSLLQSTFYALATPTPIFALFLPPDPIVGVCHAMPLFALPQRVDDRKGAARFGDLEAEEGNKGLCLVQIAENHCDL